MDLRLIIKQKDTPNNKHLPVIQVTIIFLFFLPEKKIVKIASELLGKTHGSCSGKFWVGTYLFIQLLVSTRLQYTVITHITGSYLAHVCRPS